MMRRRLPSAAVFVACYLVSGYCFAGFGKLWSFNATDGGKQQAVRVGDLVTISVDASLVLSGSLPTSDVLDGTAVRFVALVGDGKSFVAYFSPATPGSGRVYFSYTRKDNQQTTVAVYQFSVSTQTVGRTLEFGGPNGGLKDVATGNAPEGGAKVGDIIRVTVTGTGAGLQAYGSGDLVMVVDVVQGQNIVIYYSLVKAGHVNSIGYSVNPTGGDGGFLSPTFDIFPY